MYVKTVILFLVICSTNLYADISPYPEDECGVFLEKMDKETNPSSKENYKRKSSSNISHTFLWENDAYGGGSDKHYTNGMKLLWIHNPCRYKNRWLKEKFYKYTRAKNNKVPTASQVFSGGIFGINMYTPNIIERADRNLNDRPYAGWLYLGKNIQTVNKVLLVKDGKFVLKDKSIHALELQYGVVGPGSAQEYAQKFIHREITGSTDPQGWDNQIPGQLGLNALYTYKKNHFIKFDSTKSRLTSHLGFSVGNVVNFVNGGFTLSLGNIGEDYPSNTIQPTSPLGVQRPPIQQNKIKALLDSTEEELKPQYVPTKSKSVFYAYAGIDFRYVFYSIFINDHGGVKHDIELVPGVYDLTLGVAYKTESRKFGYKYVKRSKEFLSNDDSLERSHAFGQFEYEWYF